MSRDAPPRRVLFPYVGDSIGGSHVSSLHLVRGLDRRRFEPVVGLHDTDGPLAAHLAGLGIAPIALPAVPLPGMGSLRRQVPVFARATLPCRRLLRAQAIDIVHTNDIRLHMLWGLPARLASTAHLWHQRTPTRSHRLDSYARLASAAVTISEFCRSELPPRLRAKAQVVANPFDLPDPPNRRAARQATLRELGAPEDAAVIGYVSNFADRKRPLLMVALATALTRADRPQSYFPMFGEARPPLGEAVDAAISDAGLEGRVVPMGPRFPIEPWLAGCDVLVAPARREGFGRTLVEAMLCGTPVVASDEGGHREILRDGETGLLVPPDDVAAFAAAVGRLLDAPALAESLARTARTDASGRYSVSAHVAAIEAIYDGI